MNETNEKIEYIISQVADMRDNGKSIADILNKFPEHQEEIKDVFLIIDELKNSKNLIEPPKELLRSIIDRIPKDSVTNSNENRYIITEDSKGRVLQQIISNIYFIAMNKKLAGLLAVLLVVALGSVYFWQQKSGQDAITQKFAATDIEFDQDITDDIDDIEYIAQDTSLDNLETELAMINENDIPSPGKTAADSVSLDALDAELSYSLDSLSGDFNDIEGVTNDMSLDSIDSGLSGI